MPPEEYLERECQRLAWLVTRRALLRLLRNRRLLPLERQLLLTILARARRGQTVTDEYLGQQIRRDRSTATRLRRGVEQRLRALYRLEAGRRWSAKYPPRCHR